MEPTQARPTMGPWILEGGGRRVPEGGSAGLTAPRAAASAEGAFGGRSRSHRQGEGDRGRLRPPRPPRRVVRARRRDRARGGGRPRDGRERPPVHRRRDQPRHDEGGGPRDAGAGPRHPQPARGEGGRRGPGAARVVGGGVWGGGPNGGGEKL